MTARGWGNEYRTTTVCVDSYKDGVFVGRFYNRYRKEGSTFQSMMQFIQEMERTLDMMDFPKAFTASRAFAPIPESKSSSPEGGYRLGEAATFYIRILFRQNASWQGSVTWLEGEQEQSFRSALELMLLMDSALSYKKAS